MKKSLLSISLLLLCTVFLCGCQTTTKAYLNSMPQKIVSADGSYITENVRVVEDRVEAEVEDVAEVSAGAAMLPWNFLRTFWRKTKGSSDKNPYERTVPYTQNDFRNDVLFEEKQGIVQPTYERNETYANLYRAPFLFTTEEGSGLAPVMTVKDIERSPIAKQYLSFQQEMDLELSRARDLYEKGYYSDALAIVDTVMEKDVSMSEGRVLFEQIIRAREENQRRKEATIREQILDNEKINVYLSEARDYLAEGDFDEAERATSKALEVDRSHEGAREMADAIDIAKFERTVRASGTTSRELLERMIYRHLSLYKQYTNEGLENLAKKELQKVSVLESYRDRIEPVAGVNNM